MVQPTVEMAEAFSKDRVAPMIRDTPVLREIFTSKSRDSGDTILQKAFPGGRLNMTGANAPATLASRPIRIVLCDEVDRFPASAGTEGDPVSLAEKRTTTFWNRKIGLVSTPTIKGESPH
jgi:phage terminase large subunit GpA-like protein